MDDITEQIARYAASAQEHIAPVRWTAEEHQRRRPHVRLLIGVAGAALLAVGVTVILWPDDGSRSEVTLTDPTDPTPGQPSLRTTVWERIRVPASVCGGEAEVQLEGGQAVMSSTRWRDDWKGPTPSVVTSQVQISLYGLPITYGDVDGDGREDAVVLIDCSNGGGTGSSRLGTGLVVFTGGPSQPVALGTLVPTQGDDDDEHLPSILGVTRLDVGSITVEEHWYRDGDTTAEPSGRATTVWTYDGSTFVPGEPHASVMTQP